MLIILELSQNHLYTIDNNETKTLIILKKQGDKRNQQA